MKLFKNARKYGVGAALSVALVGGANAKDWTTEIGTATTEATGNSTAVIAGCVGLAVLGFGVAHMMGWFTRK